MGELKPTVHSTYVGADGFQYALMSDGSSVKMGPSAEGAATTQTRQNAFDLLKDQFTTFGVFKKDKDGNYDDASNSLLTTLNSLIMGGAGADTTSLTLQQSDAYKARFAGNTARLAAGLNVLSPRDYIATENAYEQIFKASGMPTSFYQGTAEKAKLIGMDIAPTELQDRVNIAAKSITDKDPYYTSTLKNYYGLTAGDMIAHALDPQATLPILQRQQGAANFGAAAARQGLAVSSNAAEQFAGMGVTGAQAEQGFGQIAAALPNDQKLAQIYGGQFGNAAGQQSLLTNATFGGPNAAQAELQLKKLQQQETNQFSGSSGVSKGSLQGDQAGTF